MTDGSGENVTCQCFAGFTGEFCDILLPPPSICDLIDCNNGTCVTETSENFTDASGESFTCECFLGFTGEFCDILLPPPSICDLIDCNNGTCVTNVSSENFTCECFAGFTGEFCDIILPPPSICDVINCNNGTCVTDVSENFTDASGESFTCECFSGFTGEFCDIILPPPSICDVINCNNGTCVTDVSENFTDASGESFTCECFSGFTGEFCDIILPPPSICDVINCSNGTCVTDGSGGNFTCQCFAGFTGEFCDITLSPPSICDLIDCNNGTCVTDISENLTDTSGESFTCQCFAGFTGEFCDILLPPPNICDLVDCNNGTCVADVSENLTDTSGEIFTCECYVGWTGPLCETDIDFCQPDNFGSCNQMGTAMCVDGNSTHTCECLSGFTGDLCSVDIDDCDPDPCINNATCIDLPFSEFMCECLPGFTGELCEETFSPCNPNPCKEPEEVCIVTGFEEDDFLCVPPPTTTTVIDATTTLSLLISTPSLSISTIGQPSSLVSLSTSMTSATPTPTPVPPNSAPTVLNQIGTLLANEGQVTHFTIPELTFYDAESGTTSNLRLSLLDSSANELPNTTWIHLSNGAIQALPLREQTVLDLVTEYTFLLKASDEQGASTHDFVTVRVLRQREDFQNFLVVMFEGSFTTFNQSLTNKIALTQRLSAHINGISSSVASILSTPNIFLSAFRNGSIVVAYRDISIPDTHCADFRAWVATVYSDLDSNYTPSFVQFLSPRFVPIAQPMIDGPCNITDINPTIAATQGLSPIPQSNIILFLATVIPTIFVACICLLIGILFFINYRSRRSERKGLRSRAMERTFTHRRPVILDEEWDLPNRRRRPVILPTDYTVANTRALAITDPANDGNRGRRLLLEEIDYGGEGESSDEEEIMTAPGLGLIRRNRHAMMSPDPPLDDGPPPYVLPPLFPNND